MAPHNLGDLQQLTMLALLRLADDAYGARIRQELERVAGRDLSISAIYVTLVRLEDQGLVESQYGAGPARGGRSRRCFRVTDEGLEALRWSREATDRMWSGLESYLTEKSAR